MSIDTPPPKQVDGDEPEDMVRVDEDTGEVFTDPEPTEPTDVTPEFVEANRGKE